MPAIQSLQLKNPRTIDLVEREQLNGGGRSLTETAENMIAEAAEHRRAQRERDTVSGQSDGANGESAAPINRRGSN